MSRRRRKAAATLEEASAGFILLSRVLISVMLLLLAVIPWSEQYSALDNFPHGQDLELNLLAFFVILGLILLFVRSRKRGLSALFVLLHYLLARIRIALATIQHSLERSRLSFPHVPPLPNPALSVYNLPLQI